MTSPLAAAAAGRGFRGLPAGATCGCCIGDLMISATGSWAYSLALLAWVSEQTHRATAAHRR
jgi:hypothetical protein